MDKMREFMYVSVIFLCFLMSSCHKETKEDSIEIFIDFSNIENLDLSNAEIVNLQFTDNSILRKVDELILYNDSNFLIRSGQNLFVFERNGKFKNQIGSKGNGPMEFTHFNSFYIEDNTVHIYDAMAKKMISYELNGKFINSVSLKDIHKKVIPNLIYPIANGKFISKNTFGGEESKLPSYSILDENYIFISNIKNRYLKNGITTLNNFFADNEYTLFWELLNDTIFTVTNLDTYLPKYYVNFNEKAVPNDIKKLDLYDAIEFVNKPENKQKYATLIRSVSEDNLYLRFIFFFNGDVYYTKYDKEKDYTKTYKITHKSDVIEPLLTIYNGKIIVPINIMEDNNCNPMLAIIDESIL